jgi:hypothetical protein
MAASMEKRFGIPDLIVLTFKAAPVPAALCAPDFEKTEILNHLNTAHYRTLCAKRNKFPATWPNEGPGGCQAPRRSGPLRETGAGIGIKYCI